MSLTCWAFKIRELTKRLDAVSNFNRELVKMTSKEADDNAVQMAAKVRNVILCRVKSLRVK